MYVWYCPVCKKYYEDGEIDYIGVDEPRGEYWGVPCTERIWYPVCPDCGETVYEELEPEDEEEE